MADFDIRTQVELTRKKGLTNEDMTLVLWVKAREGSIEVGDRVTVEGNPGDWTVKRVLVTLREGGICVPHHLGELTSLYRTFEK